MTSKNDKALDDSGSLMGKHDVKTEEDEIRKVLAGQQKFEDTVRSVSDVGSGGSFDDFFARLVDAADADEPARPPISARRRPGSEIAKTLSYALQTKAIESHN